MKYFKSGNMFLLNLLVLLVIGLRANAAAQNHTIEDIELVNMGDYYRIIVHSTGPIFYVSKSNDIPPQIIVYIRNAKLNLTKRRLHYNNTLIKKIEATQWKKSPAIVKITIALERALKYEINKKMSDLIYLDIMKATSLLSINSTNEITSAQKGNNGTSLLFEEMAKDNYFIESSVNNSTQAPKSIRKSQVINETSSDRIPAPLASNTLISLDVKAADISNVLRLIAKQTNLNIVASRDVTGVVTVSLAKVGIKQALDMIAKANGFDYIIKEDVILVKPPDKFQFQELQTKIYRLKYLNANNLKTTLAEILSEKAKIQVFYHDFQQTGEENKDNKEAQKNRSSTLIVTDIPANFTQLDALIEALDVPTAQIMIEAKLIEISPQDQDELGIDWSKTITAELFREVLLPSGTQYRYSSELPVDGGSINFGTLKIGQYDAVLDFLNSHTNAKLVSNPRILATDNQQATISVGTNFPIPQINRGVGGQGDVVTFEYRDIQISLKVTPHVAEDQTINLHVNPIIEEITGAVAAGSNSAPIISKREVETVVNLKSNETVVIGGLIKESTIETTEKVWLLGDIPLIGNLFRHKSKIKKQTDLLIFITPRLLE